MNNQNANDRQRFEDSCNAADNFPSNLVFHNTYPHILRTYVSRLDDQENKDRLFYGENASDVEVWEYSNQHSGDWPQMKNAEL
jgi:hypothetical protein